MLVAVQGCSHGSLSAIYDSIHHYTSLHSRPVDLLLLCGDFQALRSAHDFASLAVPPKYHQLGTFHEYYSGKRVAPVLTIVIGGNHEASNYMWELYHGGWLAPKIYYLGAAGVVNVGGWRIVGASGIYKEHDYHKGHFEIVPYNNSTLRSIYHIRQYDVAKLAQLSKKDKTIFLSHDWPTTIPKHGNLPNLLRRKPFFRSEVESNTLGSPPLSQLLKSVQPEYWFSAHLHVKFAALYHHDTSDTQGAPSEIQVDGPKGTNEQKRNGNPDEIDIDSDEDDDEHTQDAGQLRNGEEKVDNPDEITMDSDEDNPPIENNDGIPKPATTENAAPKPSANIDTTPQPASSEVNGKGAPDQPEAGPSRPRKSTRFLALDKCGPGKDHLQFLDLPNDTEEEEIRLTFEPEWLAITRVCHPYLSLDIRPKPMPLPDHLHQLVQDELAKIKREGLLVPSHPERTPKDVTPGVPDHNGEQKVDDETSEIANSNGNGSGGANGSRLVLEKGSIEIERVQHFWPTAPAHGQPGGSPSAWYTNPQTEALCGMLQIPNKINPAPFM